MAGTRGSVSARAATPGSQTSPLSSALDSVKQGVQQTAQQFGQNTAKGLGVWKDTAQGLGKIPFKLGGTVADIGLGIAGQQPLKPFNVPGLGKTSTYARQSVDAANNPDSIFYNKPILSGVNAASQGVLDTALAGGIAKTAVNEPGGFSYDPSKGSYGSLNQAGRRNASGGLNLLDKSPALPQQTFGPGSTVYRGEGAGNAGGLHFTTDQAWAKNFGDNMISGKIPENAKIYNLQPSDMENAYKNGLTNEGDVWKSIFNKGYDAISGHDAMRSSVPDIIVNPALRSTFATPVTPPATPTASLMSQLDSLAARNLNPVTGSMAGVPPLGAALNGKLQTSPIQSILDKLTGTVRIDNTKNPNSASYKVNQSMGKPNPAAKKSTPKAAPKKAFRSTLPSNQKVFGAGVGP